MSMVIFRSVHSVQQKNGLWKLNLSATKHIIIVHSIYVGLKNKAADLLRQHSGLLTERHNLMDQTSTSLDFV